MVLSDIGLSNSEYQIRSSTITPDGRTFAIRLEIVWMRRIQKWMMSIFNETTGETYLTNVPLVVSIYDPIDVNDLLAQFGYLRIGSAYLLPRIQDAVEMEPTRDTITKYIGCWGDRYVGLE